MSIRYQKFTWHKQFIITMCLLIACLTATLSANSCPAVKINPVNKPKTVTNNTPEMKHHIIYKKDGIYACFPDLFIFSDGRLGTTFCTRTARNHIDPTGGALSMISSDNAQTWQTTDQPLLDRRWKTKNGRFVRAQATGWVYVPETRLQELRSRHKVIMQAKPDTIAYLGGATFETYDSAAKSWKSHPIEIPKYISGLMVYNRAASDLRTSSNIRLKAVYGPRIDPNLPKGLTKSEVFLLRSKDDGQTWKCRPMYPDGLPDPNIGFNETTLVETANGTIIAMMRSDPDAYLHQSNSTDGGKTWFLPRNTGIWGTPAHLLRVDNNTIVCTHGYRRKPLGIRACVSRDGGKTWQTDKEIILRSDGYIKAYAHLGYPMTCLLPDGKLFTIYYMTTQEDNKNTHVASTIWQLPEE